MKCLAIRSLIFVVAFAATTELGQAADAPASNAALTERAAAELKKADSDGDGQLTLAEFLAPRTEANRLEDQRRFLVFDFDANEKLSGEEFRQLIAPADERGAIPDPIVEMEQRALSEWLAAFKEADKDGSAKLSRAQWPGERIARDIPALAGVPFEQWDRDQNGEVTQDEGRWLLEVAYGLALPDGRSMRTPPGRVFAWYYFRHVDEDGDGLLSREEFVSRHHQGEEANAKIFAELDQDRDRQLTVEETFNLLWHDSVGWFLAFDRDQDGYLNTDEFIFVGWGTNLARRMVPAFDADGDGKISFREFRQTTFPNQASDWMRLRRDADNDGRLSRAEYYIEKSPVLVAQSRWFFDHFDLDHDGWLSLDELEFSIDAGKVPPEVALRAVDGDHDGFVSREEHVDTAPEAERIERARRFLIFDFNGDGKLAAGEYRDMMAQPDDRRAVLDPMAQLEQAALEKLEGMFATSNSGGSFTRREWPTGKIASEIPALAGVPFEQWDRDGNGSVDREDARRLLEVAYGLTLPDGRRIRAPSGRVFAWYYFRYVDKNDDGLLSREEFVSGHHQGKEVNQKIFVELDEDRDGRLTVEETFSLLWHDSVGWFLGFDRDRDGYMTAADFLSIGWGTNLAKRTVPAFDADGDGKISFREFRETTFPNQASDWMRPRRDADNDGRLSWAEYYIEKSPVVIAQSRWFFDHFDLDHDGFLSYEELEFEAEPGKVPAEYLFAARDADGDGKLTLLEVFTETKPQAADASALDQYELRLAAAENRFAADDKDSSGYLDLQEFGDAQQAVAEAARRQEKVLSDRKTLLEGNYWMRKSVLVVNEIAFLAIVWMLVRRTKTVDGKR